jgi:hypothetical protein
LWSKWKHLSGSGWHLCISLVPKGKRLSCQDLTLPGCACCILTVFSLAQQLIFNYGCLNSNNDEGCSEGCYDLHLPPVAVSRFPILNKR